MTHYQKQNEDHLGIIAITKWKHFSIGEGTDDWLNAPNLNNQQDQATF